MNKKNYYSLSSYMELSPFVIVHSLLMHVMVLSFLLTLPIYSKINEKKSLLGYSVYLTGEETIQTQASAGQNISEKKIETAKNIEKTIIPGKIIDDIKTKEEIKPSGPIKETGNNSINMENITGEVPSYTGPDKEAETIGKETSKIEEVEKAAPVLSVDGVLTAKPAEPHIQPETLLSGIDQARKIKVEKIASDDRKKNIESPNADFQLPSKSDASPRVMEFPEGEIGLLGTSFPQNDASPRVMEFPEGKIELSGTSFSQITEKAKTTDKGRSKIEQPETTIQSMSGNKSAHDKKNAIHAADDNEKGLTRKDAEGTSSPLKTGKAVDKNTGMRAKAPKTIAHMESSKRTVPRVMTAQNHIQDDSAQKVLGVKKKEAPSLLPDIDNIIKKVFSELQPVDEKKPELRTEAEVSILPSALAGEASESNIGKEEEKTDVKYYKGPEKNEKAISKIKDKVEEGAEAEEAKSVLGLPVDESFFQKDIKIEVLQQKTEGHGIYMYLLKNSYLSLDKRHSWGKEKKVETIVETKKKNDAENEMRTFFSVAKSDSGIYTFVIENRNAEPFNTEVVFALYGGQKRERIRKISAVSVPPSSRLRFMFVLPDTVFWDDEKFFTGSIEDSDSITKFNDEAGFVWKEEKDN